MLNSFIVCNQFRICVTKCLFVHINSKWSKTCDTSLTYFLGILGRSYSSFIIKNDNIARVCTLDTMPKRSRQSSTQSKKSRNSSNQTQSKRNSIPRSCKNNLNQNNTNSKFDEFDNLLSMIPTYNLMGSSKTSFEEKEVEAKHEKKAVTPSWSSDELDVVFDVQEDKKKKIYEVITVMSDDETPNEVSFERIYADDPEKRKVDESEVPLEIRQKQFHRDKEKNDTLAKSLNLTHLDIEVKPIDSTPLSIHTPQSSFGERESFNAKGKTSNICIDDSDSDSIVCVAVINPKTKAGEKKKDVEEVCLSSDSETSSYPKIPPIKLKYTSSDYASITDYRDSYSSGHSYRRMDRNDFNYKSAFMPSLYPYNQLHTSKPVSEFESLSNSSSDRFLNSSSPSISARTYSEDGSSSAHIVLGKHKKTKTSRYKSESSSSTQLSSSDEEKDEFLHTGYVGFLCDAWISLRHVPLPALPYYHYQPFYYYPYQPSYYNPAQALSKIEVRYEEFTESGRKIHKGETEVDSAKSFTFKLLSYNVLSQYLLEKHIYLYTDNDRRALNWVHRWNLIYNEIKDENPEILCLQEVQHSHILTHFNKLCDLGYKYVYKKRTGHQNDGVAVFFKSSLFTEERVARVEYYQPGVPVLDRDNVGVVVRLRLKQSPADAIVVATTHLLYNPKRNDIKLAQTQVLLAEIDRVAYNIMEKKYFPIILTGDFNLVPETGVYKLLTEGKFTYEGSSRRTLLPEGKKHILTKTLLPLRLGITDNCQHVDVLTARSRGEEVTTNNRLFQLFHSELNVDPSQSAGQAQADNRFGTGTLKQNFKFLSVYPHIKEGVKREATTYHSSWVTVDYIFYSTLNGNESQSTDEKLLLLSRLRLPVEDELDMYIGRLPNLNYGSDHLPLVCKFMLRLH